MHNVEYKHKIIVFIFKGLVIFMMDLENNINKPAFSTRIIVAHPYKQHSYQMATALRKTGRLFKYITTVYDQGSPFSKIVKMILRNDYKEKLDKKSCVHLNDGYVKQYCEISGYIFLILARIKIFKNLYRIYGAWMNKRFGIKVAKFAIKSRADAVIMYDTTADSCFYYLKNHAPEVIRILDVSSNASIERLKLYNSIILKDPTSELKEEFSYLWNSSFQRRNIREIQNSNYFFVPSYFSRQSIMAQGIDEDKLFLVHYGVDTGKFKYVKRKYGKIRRLKFVYTGVVSYEKGVNTLLEALSLLPEDQYCINIMGIYNPDSRLYNKYKDSRNINFLGYVSHSELSKIYSDADVFVIASLGEGFTLSGLEAMSCGLPVICSENSGIGDVVENYVNGIIFKTGDVSSLYEKLQWIYYNQNLLPIMSEKAFITSRKYSWDTYYTNVNKTISDILVQNR